MTRLGVAISCHDKVAELETCLNVIRNHWSDSDAFIGVCCNDPSSMERIQRLEPNAFVEGVDYRSDGHSKAWKRMRQYDTIKKAVLACCPHTDFVIQWHADAMALQREPIDDIIACMDEHGYDVAVRGKWKRDSNSKRPWGHVDDHFVVFRSSHVIASGLFEETDEQVSFVRGVAASWSSEGILSCLIQKVTPLDRIHHYDDMRHNVIDMGAGYLDDPFYNDGVCHSAIPPLNFDPHRKFLHSDTIDHTRRIFEQEGVPLELITEQ